jgi:hypothetical protein
VRAPAAERMLAEQHHDRADCARHRIRSGNHRHHPHTVSTSP